MHNNISSKAFEFLRFPLIIAVIFIHSPINVSFADIPGNQIGDQLQISYIISFFISEILARIAVPLFFFISGFLFFRNIKEWDWNLYISKLKRRSKSLLFPYIFWNAIAIFAFFLIESCFPELFSGKNILIRDYTFLDFLKSFWMGNSNSGYPINYPLWFIRSLMTITIFSPIIWILIKYIKIFTIITLGICFILVLQSRPIFPNLSTLFFFTTGAYMAYNNIDPIKIFISNKKMYYLTYIFLACLSLILMNHPEGIYIKKLSIIIGIPAVLCLTAKCIDSHKLHMPASFSSSAFFIFASHGLLILFINKVLFYILHPVSQLALISCYFSQVLFTVGILLGVYTILKRFFPKFTALITGNRI